MALPVPQSAVSLFIAWENEQSERHEFHRGEVFAMVGARRVHGLVELNLAAALRSHLKRTPCRAFVNGMKVQIADEAVYYPDVFVTCDPRDLATDVVFRHPRLVIEVLSPSTQAYDRGEKFGVYRRLPSLEEYVVVDPDRRQVEVFRRNADGRFELHDQTGSAFLELSSVDLCLPMAEVFDGVEPPTAESRA